MLELIDAVEGARPVHVVPESGLDAWLEAAAPAHRAWATAQRGKQKAGTVLALPAADGTVGAALAVVGNRPDIWSLGDLDSRLPAGDWTLDLAALAVTPSLAGDLALGMLLGSYRFDRYLKSSETTAIRVTWPEGVDRARVLAFAGAITRTRDLINTPAQDMGPPALEEAGRRLAGQFDGTVRVVVGDDLLAENFPMVHAVGRAAASAPRLIDLCFGDPAAPKVTLVGKGVCFDTGGLDLKPASGMELMRKDMGGAATVLGLAEVILATRLPVRLRVIVPAVENAVAGNAYRPGDILASRKGITVEIGNTDAEGRLILADALALAGEESPDLLIDMATLTGAARVAVGTELSAYFASDESLAAAVETSASATVDPVWRLPLHDAYRHLLDTPFADINNSGSGGFAGATTAALFLKEFVAQPERWLHFDIMAWNSRARPGRPKGGEAMALRALHALIAGRFDNSLQDQL
ncbi:MAG: leucyl aminopeptidase family protein [Pseudomonadota bacterium]|nr:leucyl aminopeptidase family protein [Pseudomonadota bacterium]